jgi:hypothetical protein
LSINTIRFTSNISVNEVEWLEKDGRLE